MRAALTLSIVLAGLALVPTANASRGLAPCPNGTVRLRPGHVAENVAAVSQSVRCRTVVRVSLPPPTVLRSALSHQNLTNKAGVFATASGARRHYELSIAYTPTCFDATACFIGLFSGQIESQTAWTRLYRGTHVRLTRGVPGVFHASSCGGSCAPPTIWWRQGGVTYAAQGWFSSRRTERSTMIGIADAAIRNG